MKQMSSIEKLSRLQELHAQLEYELGLLTRRGHMTPSEQLRARVIKKEKLLAKDLIRTVGSSVTNS
jgi:hypothetical protein